MSTGKFYREFTEIYDEVTLAQPTYLELVRLHKDALKRKERVLDSACGPSELAVELIKQNSEVHAVDMNHDALSILRRKAENSKNLHVYECDAHKLPFKDSYFDGVSSMLALPFMEDPIGYLVEHSRVMKEGSVFVLSGPNEKAKDTDWIMNRWESDLARVGKLQELGNKWKIYRERLTQSAQTFVRNWYTAEQLSGILERDIGLHVVEKIPNPQFYGRGYVIVAEK